MIDAPRSGTPGGSSESDPMLLGMAALVDASLEKGYRWMRFPAPLERLFEQQTGATRSWHLIISSLVGVLIYDLFLFIDYLMIPDVFGVALLVRLGAVTPLFVVLVLVLRRPLSPMIREGLQAALILCMGMSMVYLLALSDHPFSVHYHPGLILVIMFGNIVVRLRFWLALATTAAIVALYVLVAPYPSVVAPTIGLNNIVLLCISALFTLFANYLLERDYRYSYLQSVRERIHRAELSLHNAELTRLSHLDPLTGIANRRELSRYLTRLRQGQQDKLLGVVMLDVDYFKRYNDLYGHPAGDECLLRIAGALNGALRRSSDIVARFGGEEFVVVLPGANRHAVQEIADTMRQAVMTLAIPHRGSAVSEWVTVSAGGAVGDPQTDVQTILAQADAALYEAKGAGRNCVQLFEDTPGLKEGGSGSR